MAKIYNWMGHSGEEGGAVGLVVEDNVTRDARSIAKAYFEACGHTVVSDADNMSLTQRIKASTDSNAYLIEWHANSGGGTGSEFWYSKHAKGGRGQKVAEYMNKVANSDDIPYKGRGAYPSDQNRLGGLGILDRTAPTAILVELMFVDSQSDAEYWNANKKKVVEAYAKAFLDANGLKSTPSGKPSTSVSPSPKPNTHKSVSQIAAEVINGAWGNGEQRTQNLRASGYDANAVQAEVNRILSGQAPKRALKPNSVIAQEVLNGSWGNNPSRKAKLKAAGYNYESIQAAVNAILANKKPAPKKKSNTEVAQEVINGNWGNGQERATRLRAAGYSPDEIQRIVNRLLS